MNAGIFEYLLLCGLTSLVTLTGCVSVQQIPISNASLALQEREISLASRDKPDFGATTPGLMTGGALFGAVGGAIAGSTMVSAGNQLVAEHNLTDPAELIGPTLVETLSEKFSARAGKLRPRLSTDDAGEAAKTAAGAEVVLDVRTINWGLTYIPNILRLGSEKYRVIYTARGRLIDVKQGKVLAEAGCVGRTPANESDASTYNELLANSAARLKQELLTAADLCVQQLATRMFSLEVSGVRRERDPSTDMAGRAPADAASAPPSASPVAVAVQNASGGALPAPGSVWSYTFRDRVFGNRAREFSVRAAAVDESSVTEILSSGSEQQMFAANPREVGFHTRRISGEDLIEVSPYLLVHLPAPALPLPQSPRTYPGGGGPNDWKVRATEVLREQVSVPAGRFEAFRVKFIGENENALFATSTAHAVNAAANDYVTQHFEYTVWYAPQIGRYVQVNHKAYNKYGKEVGDEWIQLTGFQQGKAHPPK